MSDVSAAEWRRFRVAMLPLQLNLLAGVAAASLALLPLYAWMDVRRIAIEPDGPWPAYVAVHAAVVIASVAFLTWWLLARRRGVLTGPIALAVGRVGVAITLSVGTGLAILNQLGDGSVTIQLLALLTVLFVSHDPPGFTSTLVVASAGLLALVSGLVGPTPFSPGSVQVNVLMAGVGTAAGYAIIDRYRFRTFRQQRELERLNALKDLAFRAMGHDLKQPLLRLQRVARILEDPGTDLATSHLEVARQVERVADHAALVIDNLIAVGAEADRAADIDHVVSVAAAIDQGIELMRAEAALKDVTIERTGEDDVLALGHEGMLTSVVQNLLSNAVKYSFGGGTLSVGVVAEDDHVVVQVKDDGVGVPTAVLDDVRSGRWTRSSQGTEGEIGSGLGLMVVKGFVERMRGDWTLDSAPGAGTVVRVRLRRYLRTPSVSRPAMPEPEVPA